MDQRNFSSVFDVNNRTTLLLLIGLFPITDLVCRLSEDFLFLHPFNHQNAKMPSQSQGEKTKH